MMNTQNPTSRAKGVGMLVLQALVAMAVYGWIVAQSFSVAGCDSKCNYSALNAAFDIYIWVAIASLTVCLIGVIALSLHGRESWWVPAIGLSVTLLVGAFTLVSFQVVTGS